MGRYIRRYFESRAIDTSGLIPDRDGGVNGLAVTEIKSAADCGSVMYRDNAADLHLAPGDIRENFVASSKVLLVSGTALSAEPSRAAAFLAADYAMRNGTALALDIDYRPFSWRSEDETAIYLSLFCEKCDIIIGNREEFDLLDRFADTGAVVPGISDASGVLGAQGISGAPDVEVGAAGSQSGGAAAEKWGTLPGEKESEHSWTCRSTSGREADRLSAERWLKGKARLVIVKRGAEGSVCFTEKGSAVRMGIYPAAEMKKTFGAGDAFAAAFLAGLLRGATVEESLRMGSASASLVVERTDCSEAMPTEEEIRQRMGTYGAGDTGLPAADQKSEGEGS